MERTPDDGWPMVTLGEAVSVSRGRLGISQKELAKRCALSRNTVSLIERDKLHDLALSTFLTLHQTLNLPIHLMIDNWQNTLDYQRINEATDREVDEMQSGDRAWEEMIDRNGIWNPDEEPELDEQEFEA